MLTSIKGGANICNQSSNAAIVISNSYCDASLLTSAIRGSVGGQVEIFGSTSGRDLTYVARLGARAALRMRNSALKDLEWACQYADRDEEEWFKLHGEL
jgi:hypothetical protein